MLVLSTVSLVKIRSQQPWPPFALLIAGLSLVPLIQLAAGQIRLAGIAWISSLYLIGFLLAILTGARWQFNRGGELADALFLSVGGAATVSVGIQLCQWLNVTEGCLCSNDWVLPLTDNYRVGSNLAQPNQLATLLLLGITAYAWAWVRKTLNSSIVILAIAFLLTGLALTESRMSVVSLGVMLLFTWYWRGLWPSKLTPYITIALFSYFVVMFVMQKNFTQWLLLDYASTIEVRVKNESRLDMWAMFLKAALERPWLGYGWNQSALAQVMTTTAQTTPLGNSYVVTSYAHNLFIDLILWLGIPLGFLASLTLVRWFIRAAGQVKNNLEALLMLCVTAMSTHAMLELPLYYAYFLLPLGLMIGMLDVRLNSRYAFVTGLRGVVCIWLICTTLFFAVARDYFAIEKNYAELRLSAALIESKNGHQPSTVLILTQLRDYIALAQFEPTLNMSQDKIDWVSNITMAYPADYNLLKLATVLALNGQELQAHYWLEKLCNLYGATKCAKGQVEWERLQIQFPQLVKVQWPTKSAR